MRGVKAKRLEGFFVEFAGAAFEVGIDEIQVFVEDFAVLFGENCDGCVEFSVGVVGNGGEFAWACVEVVIDCVLFVRCGFGHFDHLRGWWFKLGV